MLRLDTSENQPVQPDLSDSTRQDIEQVCEGSFCEVLLGDTSNQHRVGLCRVCVFGFCEPPLAS